MCGLTGKIFFDISKDIDAHELKQMADSIYHRGPDDEGFYINKHVGLGFRRLSVIDLSKGNPLLSNYLARKYVKTMVQNNQDGMRDFSVRIWSLLWFEEWLKQNQQL